jgi:hypothetical protein
MKKQVCLKHKGYSIQGTATIRCWDGYVGEIKMDSTFIPDGKLTKENILKSINDGRFGCESILKAKIVIYDVFDNKYIEPRGLLDIDMTKLSRFRFACRGV